MKEKEKNLNEPEEKKKSKKPENQEILYVSYLFLGIFLCMIGYFVYFQTVVSSNVITSPYNKRQDMFADRIVRGDILTNDGTVIATTEVAENGSEKRVYPYDRMFAHAVGFSTKGKSGVELQANYQLLSSHAYFPEKFFNEVRERKNIGDRVITTFDYKLQKTAYEALGKHDGAVVALEASTGKILALVSKPDYDPNKIDADWEKISTGKDAVLLNRATQGKYPPGSIFKTITLLEYYREGNDLSAFQFDCSGKYTYEDVSVRCSHGIKHGQLDLKKAYAKSCNGAFSNIGLSLDQNRFMDTCNGLLFNAELPLAMPYNKSSISVSEKSDIGTMMQTAIGQSRTEVTPMHMAMITAAIANGGNLMKPYMIDSIENYEGVQVKKYMPAAYGKLISADEAAFLSEYMREVVESGTASKLKSDSYTAAGKTGTAEYSADKSKTHAWFTGFSGDLVVCVIVEKSGSGSEYAVPIAKKLFETYAEGK